MRGAHDYDWLVIGSGFGGSVAALRLAEKGYRVAILECGRRFADDEFPERMWQLRRSIWIGWLIHMSIAFAIETAAIWQAQRH